MQPPNVAATGLLPWAWRVEDIDIDRLLYGRFSSFMLIADVGS